MIQTISFPEDNIPAHQRQPASHKTLLYLLRLFRNTGYGVAIVYAACMLVLAPLLKTNYDRRAEFMDHVFQKVAALYTRVQKKVKHVPTIELEYNGRRYKDESVSAEEPSYFFSEYYVQDNLPVQTPTDRLYNSLTNLKRTVEVMNVPEYKKTDEHSALGFRMTGTRSDASEMQPLLFQLKQLKNFMEMVSADHPRDFFFKRSPLQNMYGIGSKKKENYVDNLASEIGECRELVEQIRMVR